MKKIILVLGVMFTCFYLRVNIKATDKQNIHVIYSDYTVYKDQEFMITLNFEQVNLYYSTQIVLELGEYFEVLSDEPCELLINSYYNREEVYVNSIENNVIRFVAFKKTTDNSSSFNNIVQITLKSKINCSDVREYLQNIKIGLFNEEYQTIPVNLITSEGIKVEWLKDLYQIELGNDLPDFTNDIKISNRLDSEYIIKVFVDKIDIYKVGPQIVTVYVYDYTNSSCVILNRTVNIVDNKKPVITGKKEVVINDFELELEKLSNYEVTDNYDEEPFLSIQYLTSSDEEIESIEEFLRYLKSNNVGFIKVTATDSSKNQSDEFIQTIKIIDNTAPTIEIPSKIIINDYEIDKFNLNDYLKVTDAYDEKPIIKYYINELENPNIINELSKSYDLNILFIAFDKYNNKSEEVNVKIQLLDTTPPQIEKINDLIINDIDFISIDDAINKSINVTDNFTLPLEFKYQYFYQEEVTKDEYMTLLYQGLNLKVFVSALDLAMNESNKVMIETKLIDTTPPNIIIKNVEEGKKYLTIPSVIYEVSDNFNSGVDVEIFLDGEIYQNTPINIIGKHSLLLVVKDKEGNETTKTVNFEIIKNNLIGCGLDADCYSENYETIIYIAFSILVLSILIFLIKIIIRKNKTKIH